MLDHKKDKTNPDHHDFTRQTLHTHWKDIGTSQAFARFKPDHKNVAFIQVENDTPKTKKAKIAHVNTIDARPDFEVYGA